MIQVFQRPESVPIHAEIKDWQGSLTDPTHGVKITLRKPDGTLAKDADDNDIEDELMAGGEAQGSKGKYVYYYDSNPKGTPPIDDPVGWWRYKITSQDGSGNDARYTVTEGAFELK